VDRLPCFLVIELILKIVLKSSRNFLGLQAFKFSKAILMGEVLSNLQEPSSNLYQ